jgi:hypothetical protein
MVSPFEINQETSIHVVKRTTIQLMCANLIGEAPILAWRLVELIPVLGRSCSTGYAQRPAVHYILHSAFDYKAPSMQTFA